MNWRTRCNPKGLSLIELLAATAILGLVLAGVVQARSNAIRRAADAQVAADAIARLDALLTEWEAAGWPDSVSIGTSGELGPRLRWRIEAVERESRDRLAGDADWLRLASVVAYRETASDTAPPLAKAWVFLPPAAHEASAGEPNP